MARDPAPGTPRAPDPACEAVTAALVAGDPTDAAHLAACPPCRARASLVDALAGSHGGVAPLPTPAPDPARLTAAVRARRARRAVGIGLALAASVLAALFSAPGAPEPPPPDLFAVVDDADGLTAPPDLYGEDLLALLDPTGEDPLAATDPLVDALLGEGSL